jgi:hypothetical protein
MGKFKYVEVVHIPRSRNAPADALAKLASALVFPEDETTQVTVEERWLLPAVLELVPEEVNIVTINVIKEYDRLQPFFNYFKHGSLPNDPVKRCQLQMSSLLCLQGRFPLQAVLWARNFAPVCQSERS